VATGTDRPGQVRDAARRGASRARDPDRDWFTPDGKLLLTAGLDGDARLWNTATGEKVGAGMHHDSTRLDACFSPDGARIATVSFGGALYLWDSATGAQKLSIKLSGMVCAVRFSVDGRQILAGGGQQVHRYDVLTGTEIQPALNHDTGVHGIAVSADGKLILTSTMNNDVGVFDAATGQQIRSCATPAPTSR